MIPQFGDSPTGQTDGTCLGSYSADSKLLQLDGGGTALSYYTADK
jgi:hypothetical protein